MFFTVSKLYHQLLFATLMISAFISAAANSQTNQAWELRHSESSLQVFTRPVADSPFLEVMATVQINAPLTRVTQLLGDGNGCPEWRAMCLSSKILKEVSDRERYVYLVLDMPWPLTDRDMVVHSHTQLDPTSSSATVKLRSDSSHYPQKDLVRAESAGHFTIDLLANQQVKFTYVMHTDLGGDLPAGAVNGRLAESTVDDLRRLKSLAEG